jgi:hypothetical protein
MQPWLPARAIKASTIIQRFARARAASTRPVTYISVAPQTRPSMEDFIRFIFRGLVQVLLEGLMSFTGRIALPLLTFGRWRVQRLGDYRDLGWHRLFKRQPDGTMLVGDLPAVVIGLLVWIVVGVLLFALLR